MKLPRSTGWVSFPRKTRGSFLLISSFPLFPEPGFLRGVVLFDSSVPTAAHNRRNSIQSAENRSGQGFTFGGAVAGALGGGV